MVQFRQLQCQIPPANTCHISTTLLVPTHFNCPQFSLYLCYCHNRVSQQDDYVLWSYLISYKFLVFIRLWRRNVSNRNSTCDGSQLRRQETNNKNRSFPFARFFYWKTVHDWFETAQGIVGFHLRLPSVWLHLRLLGWQHAATTVRIFHVDLRHAQQRM